MENTKREIPERKVGQERRRWLLTTSRWEPGLSSASLVPGGAAEAENDEDYDYDDNHHYFDGNNGNSGNHSDFES